MKLEFHVINVDYKNEPVSIILQDNQMIIDTDDRPCINFLIEDEDASVNFTLDHDDLNKLYTMLGMFR